MKSLRPFEEHLNLYKSIFKVREDAFAKRWEKGNNKGYMPSYHYDPYLYKLHRMKGGTFKNYAEKSYATLDNNEITKHLSGEQHIGGYPLFEDNTSFFIAADFDGDKWQDESVKFLTVCNEVNISAYLERSQSGNGAHVWIFFDEKYPAIRSRRVVIHLLQKAGIVSIFDKSSSFDRLFPNQDFHSGKGLGNLIALPLHGKSIRSDNSCFIDPNTHKPYQDQWQFLKEIEKVKTSLFDSIHDSLEKEPKRYAETITSHEIQINLENQLHLQRSGLQPATISFLKEELNISNSEHFIKKRSGKNTWNTKRYFNLIEDKEFEVIIPRGFTGKFLRYLKSNDLAYHLNDLRKKKEPIPFQAVINPLPHQIPAIEASKKKDFGVIVAPPGSGKTIMALKIIAEKQQPTLIIVHRKVIADQWKERIQAFLGIPFKDIGVIGSGKKKIGEKITIAMIQSLSKKLETEPELAGDFGTLIIDECHHVPSETYQSVISKLKTYYQYGLTATPFRKYSDSKLIFPFMGEVIANIRQADIEPLKQARIVIRNTEFCIPFDPKTDQFETLSKVLIHDTTRNRLILNDVIAELKNGHKAVVISERREHLKALEQFLKQHYEVIVLSGEDTTKDRETKWKRLNKGDYQVLITTGQYFGEGSDLQYVSRLFLAFPFSFKGKLVQYIGRVQRSELTPVIYDYHDHKIDYLHRLFLKRNIHYRHLTRQASLFDDPSGEFEIQKDLILDSEINVPIDELEFQYGSVSFKYAIKELKTEITFEVENFDIRPEFNVLKTYFSKVLKSKTIKIYIRAEFQNHQLLAQEAVSDDLQNINREIIDSVKFKFVERRFFNKVSDENEPAVLELSKIDELKELYDSECDLLDSLLANQEYKHTSHLRYLASKHRYEILKLRFILSPFSFVFLLEGNESYHLILETLDTEEATYIWHFDKIKNTLRSILFHVDQEIEAIRNGGRQNYMEQLPGNFSRIIHDYSDGRKGFVIWKDQLEERIT